MRVAVWVDGGGQEEGDGKLVRVPRLLHVVCKSRGTQTSLWSVESLRSQHRVVEQELMDYFHDFYTSFVKVVELKQERESGPSVVRGP